MPNRQRPEAVATAYVNNHDPLWLEERFIDEVKGTLLSYMTLT